MLLRRSASLVSRLGPQVAAAAAAEGGGSWAPQSAAALQVLDHWQHYGGGSSQGSGSSQQQHMGVRHLSFWPGSSSKSSSDQQQQQPPDSLAAAGEEFGSSSLDGPVSSFAASAPDSAVDATAAAAAASTGMSADLFSVGSIIAAAATAEPDSLSAARDDTWLGGRLVQSLLVSMHEATGLDWWSTIMVTTLGMRMATLPVMVSQIKNTYRMSQARPELEELMAQVKDEQARGNPHAAMEHQQRVLAIWKKYNCNPLKSLGGMFVQAPIFIGFFSALRGLAAHKLPSMTEGGALWFTDLTVADPTYMLPALAGLSFLLTIELGAADGMEGQTDEMRTRMKNVMRVVALSVPLVSTALPASVFMYWTASNIFSLAQTLMLKVPGVKRLVGLPDLSKLRKGSAAAAAADAGKPVQTYTHKPKSRKE